MPAIITHNLFGQKAAQALPEGILNTDEEMIAFILGNQGPDPMFFRSLGTPSQIKVAHQLASDLHNEHMSEALTWLRRGVEHLPEEDYGVGRAFALGYLAHYTLDSTTHPYIFAQQYAIQAEDPTLGNSGGPVHAVIEADIDTVLLRKLLNMTPTEYDPQSLVVFTHHITEVAGALISQIALGTLGQNFPITEYAESASDMKFIYQLMEPLGSTKSEIVKQIQMLFDDYSQIQGLCHREFPEGQSPWFNEEHYAWTCPFTNNKSTKGFLDLFNEALDKWPVFAQSYLEGKPCEEITHHINFSGEPLDSTERYEQ